MVQLEWNIKGYRLTARVPDATIDFLVPDYFTDPAATTGVVARRYTSVHKQNKVDRTGGLVLTKGSYGAPARTQESTQSRIRALVRFAAARVQTAPVVREGEVSVG